MAHDKGKLEVITTIAEKLPSLEKWTEKGDGPLRPLIGLLIVLGLLVYMVDYQFHIFQFF